MPEELIITVPSSVVCRLRNCTSIFIFLTISMAGPLMSIDWPETRGTGDRSTIVTETSRRILVSQNERQGPAMPAPDIRTLSLGADIVLEYLHMKGYWEQMKGFECGKGRMALQAMGEMFIVVGRRRSIYIHRNRQHCGSFSIERV